MLDLSHVQLVHIIIFLALPVFFGFIALKLKLPTLVGYIFSGIVLGIIVQKQISDLLSFFANIGLILLLFTIGLELQLQHLKKFFKYVAIGGVLQIVITTILSSILLFVLHFSLTSSLLLSLGFSLSSTAIISKIIQEKGEDMTLHGQLAIGILLLQDLLTIPIIIIVSGYKPNLSLFAISTNTILSLVQSGLIITVMIVAGERIIPYVFEKIGKVSRELLNVFTILFIFLCVFLFSLLGLPSTLAAFIAGLLLGQTLQHYHVFSQVRPLRDIFVILFFVFLGASINPSIIAGMLPEVIIVTIIILTMKFFVTFGIFTSFHFHSKISYGVAILLAQVGEFAFLIFQQGNKSGLIDSKSFGFAVGVTLFTLLLSPFIIDNNLVFYEALRRNIKKRLPFIAHFFSSYVDKEPARVEDYGLQNHVVICGYGRIGGYIGRALMMAKIPFVAVDYNYYTVQTARQQGTSIIYGDPTDIDILDNAQVSQASILIAAVPDTFSQEIIMLNARLLNPSIIVLTRVGQENDQKRMKDLGAHAVVHPEFEAAVSIIKKIFVNKNIAKSEISGKIQRLKIEHGMV